MRKIDKSEILSSYYSNWINQEEFKEKHPKYEASNSHYIDLKMSLLYCQGGLCAYSEKRLVDLKYFDLENWEEGKYKTKLAEKYKSKIIGDVEHFNHKLKKSKGWLWDNLFVVDVHINRNIKRSQDIKDFWKPDLEEYNPYNYLEFDLETGLFIPLYSLSDKEQEDILNMIDTLGLNCYDSDRKEHIELFLALNKKREPTQYLTAWQMTLNQLKEA